MRPRFAISCHRNGRNHEATHALQSLSNSHRPTAGARRTRRRNVQPAPRRSSHNWFRPSYHHRPTGWKRRPDRTSEDEHQRVLDQPAQRLQEFRSRRSVDHAMVAAHRYPKPLAYHQIAIDYDGLFFDCSNREYPCFGRIDYRSELIDAEHAEIGDRERRSRVFLGLESALARASGQLSRLRCNVRETLFVRVEDDWSDEAFFDSDSHSDVYAIELPNRVAGPVGIHFGVLSKCRRSRLDDDVIE